MNYLLDTNVISELIAREPNRFADKMVAITIDVMLVWGELTGRLERDGKPIAAIDSLIAASVLEGQYTLVTRNEDDFQHTGVPIINPWKLP